MCAVLLMFQLFINSINRFRKWSLFKMFFFAKFFLKKILKSEFWWIELEFGLLLFFLWIFLDYDSIYAHLVFLYIFFMGKLCLFLNFLKIFEPAFFFFIYLIYKINTKNGFIFGRFSKKENFLLCFKWKLWLNFLFLYFSK